MNKKMTAKTVRRSFALSSKLIDEVLSLNTNSTNLNKLVTIALQEYVDNKKRKEFENAENSNFIRKASLLSLISMEDRTSLPLIIKTFESGNKGLRDFTVKIFEQLDIPIYEKEKEKDKEEAK